MTGSDWQGYRLVPEDVWFFRDGRPSVAGADHYLRSIFPPFPSTLYGLIRTQKLFDRDVDLASLSRARWPSLGEKVRNEVGEWGEYGTLRMRGPWLLDGDEIRLPAPLDLRLQIDRQSGEEHVETVVRLLPSERKPRARNWSHELTPMEPCVEKGGRLEEWSTPKGKKDPESSAGWFLTLDGMSTWLAGGIPSTGQFVSSRQLWTSEVRTGVGLDGNRRQHAEHQLYTFGFIRLHKKVSLGFELSGGTLTAGKFARFGGENRAAAIESAPLLSEKVRQMDISPTQDVGCTAVAVTPALFPSGSLPHGKSIESAVVPGAILAGGWDLANDRPKPLQRAVPAGSVYYMKEQPQSIIESWPDKTEEGYGLMLIGRQPRRNHG